MASRVLAAAVATAVATAVAAAAVAAPAAATWWSATAAESASWSTGSLGPGTGLAAQGRCDLLVLQPVVDLSWQASPSTGVTSYEIRRSTDGTSYTRIGTVSGRLTTSYTDGTADGLGTTYWYRVRAVHGGWHADSAAASARTPTLCL